MPNKCVLVDLVLKCGNGDGSSLSGILYIMGIIEKRHQICRAHYGDCLGNISLESPIFFIVNSL